MDVHSLLSDIDMVVCDLDGVVYLDSEGIPGAGEALAALQGRGIDLLFVTNNSTKTPGEVVAKIEATTGFATGVDRIVTSAVVTAQDLAGKASTALVVGETAIDAALKAVGIEVTQDWRRAEAVVVGLDRGLTYEKLAAGTLALANGAVFYATNSDATFPRPDGLVPGGGAMVAALEVASGRSAVVVGKPHAAMRDYLVSRVHGRVAVVGDRPETDMAIARSGGWAGILVLSGVTKKLAEVPAEHLPDVVIGSLADLT